VRNGAVSDRGDRPVLPSMALAFIAINNLSPAFARTSAVRSAKAANHDMVIG
jgi:hypothetical protein